MTSLRAQVYAVAAADTGAGGVVSLLPDGLLGLLGGPTSAPPPAPGRPYLYLQFDAEVPFGPFTYSGLWRWRAYDVEAAGYARLRPLLARLRLLYPDSRNTGQQDYYADPDTHEVIYAVEFAGLSAEVADQGRGLLTQWADWSYRKTHRRDAVA